MIDGVAIATAGGGAKHAGKDKGGWEDEEEQVKTVSSPQPQTNRVSGHQTDRRHDDGVLPDAPGRSRDTAV